MGARGWGLNIFKCGGKLIFFAHEKGMFYMLEELD